MKKLYTILMLSICGSSMTSKGQTMKNILFIGNSFTGANDLQGIVHQFFDGAAIPVHTFAYAPGGISVGDVSMGTAAHMNNPYVFDLIRSKNWDYVVLQDNQGRFALDSAVFPSTAASKVIEGHLKIRDSLHFYHPCAKMIWFSGWGFKDEDTSMINDITTNYRVLNDKAKDVIAPIGPAWKNSFIEKKSYDLWSADGAHPDMTGSFLTAAVIYGTITQNDVSINPFNATLPPVDALYLKRIAQQTLIDPIIKLKSNLEGIKSINIVLDKTLLKAEPGKVSYEWYSGNTLLKTSTDSSFSPTKPGKYRVWAKSSLGYWQKSCEVVVTTISSVSSVETNPDYLILYPNPATENLTIKSFNKDLHMLEIYSINGLKQFSVIVNAPETNINLNGLSSGLYFIKGFDAHHSEILGTKQFIKH